MTAKYYMEKYPGLIRQAAKIVSAIEGECRTRGKIFDKLAEIFAEYPQGRQTECAAVLTYVMKRIYNQFMSKSLREQDRIRPEFKKENERAFLRQCSELQLDEVLVTHMGCAIRAIWRNIELDLKEQHCRTKFYNSSLEKYSRRFTM